ncbi:MAG: hypothetical protein JWN56_2222 [Sphingobacteriales bacterium]|nr:hypothetical protein [Sphingobacteriales bacterium]
MRKSILNKLVLFFVLISFAGCKTKKQLIVTSPVETTSENTTKSEKLKAINSAQLPFNTLAIKAKADFTIGKNSNDATMNFRIKSNEVIWVSVNVPVIGEVARALITPDSLKVINKVDATYSVKSFSFIQSFANDQVNFNTLQSVLVGNAIKEFSGNDAAVAMKGNQVILSGLLKSLTYSLLFNERNKVIATSIKDTNNDENLEINYADFYSLSGFDMPYSVIVNTTANNRRVNVNLKYLKVTLNEPLEFPFSIPSRYSLKN